MTNPNLDVQRIRNLKKLWIKATLLLAILIPSISILVIDDWSIYTDALSDFGTNPTTAGYWSIYLTITAIGLFLNGTNRIDHYFTGYKNTVLHYTIGSSCTGLFFTAIITDEYRLPHAIVAAIFFLAYTLFIFLYGFYQIKIKLKYAWFSIFTSFALILSTILMIPYSGLALFEIVYISIIMIWNYAVLYKWPIENLTIC